MRKDGQIVAVLNPDQVLVEVRNLDAFGSGKEFAVFEVRQLRAPDQDTAIPESVELPKPGRLVMEALQSDERYAVLRVSEQKRRSVVRRPSAFTRSILAMSALAEEEVVTDEVVGRSAELDVSSSLGVNVSPLVRVGDFVGVV